MLSNIGFLIVFVLFVVAMMASVAYVVSYIIDMIKSIFHTKKR